MNHAALDRDALYYPYVHITDVNWLKATLLCFPNVRRMVPASYMPNDSDEIKEFCDIAGPRGEALLTNVSLFSPAARSAEEGLLKKLKENDAFIRARYSKRQTVKELGSSANLFRLHNEKIVYGLSSYLTSGNFDDRLAWRTRRPEDRPQRTTSAGGHWLALHPALGSAILAVKAIAIAQDLGLDIVTDSSAVHNTVVSKRSEDIFEELIGNPTPYLPLSTSDTVDDLAELVVTTNFDVSRLTAKQIAELLADGKDLRRFKAALMPIAASIPTIHDPTERRKRLRAAASDVVSEWEKYKKSLPQYALDAMVGASEVKWPDLVNSLFQGGAVWALVGKYGLGIALVSYGGLKVWQGYQKKKSSPYSYLSRISSVVVRNQSFLVLPPINN